jgi:hypothetical protein
MWGRIADGSMAAVVEVDCEEEEEGNNNGRLGHYC